MQNVLFWLICVLYDAVMNTLSSDQTFWEIVEQLPMGWMVWAVIGIAFLSILIVPKLIKGSFGFTSLLGILFFLGGAIALPYSLQLFLQPTRTSTFAEADLAPQQVRWEALSESQVRITWTTAEPALGALKYGVSPINLDQPAFELDPLEKKEQHEIIVSNLEHNTTYYYEIISGGQRFNDAGEPLMFVIQ